MQGDEERGAEGGGAERRIIARGSHRTGVTEIQDTQRLPSLPAPTPNSYMRTSPIRNSTPPWDHHRALGIVLR